MKIHVKSIYQKLFMIGLVVMVTMLGIFTYMQARSQQYTLLRKGYEDSLSDVLDNIERDLKDVRKTMQFIAGNPVLQKIFLHKYASDLKANNEVEENLELSFWYQVTSPNSFIDDLKVLSATPIGSYGNFISYDENIENYAWFLKLQDTKEPLLYMQDNQLYYAYPILEKNSLHLTGVINAKLDSAKLIEELENSSGEKGWQLFVNQEKLGEKILHVDTLELVKTSDLYPITLKYHVEISLIEINLVTMLIVIILSNSIIVILFLYYRRVISKNHEQMMSEEKKQEELKLTALKAQINPHFLYNIMSMINWKAKYSGQKEISEIAVELSNFYRTALNKGEEMITIGEELSNIESYIKLKQKLVETPFTYEIICPEIYRNDKILGFILQPIVENGILHGIGSLEKGGHLKIEVTSRGDELFLIVSDNGKGMAHPEELYTLPTKGYGIKNVHQRIALKYGNQYGVSLKSNEDGTKVVIHLKR